MQLAIPKRELMQLAQERKQDERAFQREQNGDNDDTDGTDGTEMDIMRVHSNLVEATQSQSFIQMEQRHSLPKLKKNLKSISGT